MFLKSTLSVKTSEILPFFENKISECLPKFSFLCVICIQRMCSCWYQRQFFKISLWLIRKLYQETLLNLSTRQSGYHLLLGSIWSLPWCLSPTTLRMLGYGIIQVGYPRDSQSKTARTFSSAFDTFSFVPAAEGIPQSLQLDFQRILRTCRESALTIPTWVFSVIGDKHLEESTSPGTSAFSLACLEHCVIPPKLTRTCTERVHLCTCTEKDSESFYAENVDNLQIGKNLPHLCFLLMRKRHQEATK